MFRFLIALTVGVALAASTAAALGEQHSLRFASPPTAPARDEPKRGDAEKALERAEAAFERAVKQAAKGRKMGGAHVQGRGTGLANAIARVSAALERHPSKGLENALTHLKENLEKHAGATSKVPGNASSPSAGRGKP